MRKLYICLTGLILILSSSCSLTVDMPSTRMLLPESNGRLKFRAMTGISEAHEATVSTAGNNTNNPLILKKENHLNYATPSVGMFEKFDLFVSTAINTPSVIGGKLQVLGENKENAKKGNISVSIFAASGSRKKEVDDDLLDIEGNTKVDFKTGLNEGGMMVGYRFHPSFVAFYSFTQTQYDIHGNIRSDQAGLDGKSFQYNGVVRNHGIGVYSEKDTYLFRVEVIYQALRWDRTEDKNDFLFSLSGGVQF